MFVILLIVISLGLITADGIQLLLSRWMNDEAYNHGFILLLLIAYLLFQERADIRALKFSYSWIGFTGFTAMVVIMLVSYVTQIQTLQYQAFLGAMCLLALAVMGRASLKILLPISLLIFAIPLPFFTQVALTADLQLLSTNLATTVLRALEIPVYLEGNIIDLGGYKLQVVEACAGLNFMVPLLGFSHIFAYMFKTAMWKRVLLVVSSVPISIFLNSTRIAVTGVLMDWYDINSAEGFFHAFQGWLIFLISIVFLIVELILLNKVGSRRVDLQEMFNLGGRTSGDSSRVPVETRKLPKTLIPGLVVSLVAVSLTLYLESKPEIIPKRPQFTFFPEKINEWKGRQFPGSLEQMELLGADDHLFADYRYGENNQAIGLYIAYFDRQSDDKNPHSPKACLPGSGWDILSIEQVSKKIHSDLSIPVNKMIIQNGIQKQVLYYWFNLHGRKIADEYSMKSYMLRDRLLLNRSDGAIVRLTSGIYPGEDINMVEQRLDKFLSDLDPVLDEFIPNI